MKDRRTHLKVKIKSLAAEARIIRHEERKQTGTLRNSLTEHRRGIVRSEARHSQLAYGFLRGRSYEQLERNSRPFDSKRLLSLIDKFGPTWDFHAGEDWKAYQARVDQNKRRATEWVASAIATKQQAA